MELIKKTITVHGGRDIHILTPVTIHPAITSGHNKGYVMIWGNGSGYQFLAECFQISAELNKNEILYLPIQFKANENFKETFPDCDYNLNIICTNYCEIQISPKDIENILPVKVYSEQVINRSPTINTDFIKSWKTNRRLTVKIHKRNMYISTNKDGFSSLSRGACKMAEYGDDYYDFLPHTHFDWAENTSASVGVTLYHWHDK